MGEELAVAMKILQPTRDPLGLARMRLRLSLAEMTWRVSGEGVSAPRWPRRLRPVGEKDTR